MTTKPKPPLVFGQRVRYYRRGQALSGKVAGIYPTRTGVFALVQLRDGTTVSVRPSVLTRY